jgi:predicted O-methyltransferase YrrM
MTTLHPFYLASVPLMTFRAPIDDPVSAILDEIAATPEFAGASNANILSLLYTLIVTCKLQKVLQLGTYVGFSALILGDAVRKVDGVLTTLDPDERVMNISRGYISRAGLDPFVTTIMKGSTDPEAIAQVSADAPFDLIYIDSLHDYAASKEELPAYWPMLRPSGFLCLDDASESAAAYDTRGEGGVHRAIKEWLPTVSDCESILMRGPIWNPVGCLLATKVPEGQGRIDGARSALDGNNFSGAVGRSLPYRAARKIARTLRLA